MKLFYTFCISLLSMPLLAQQVNDSLLLYYPFDGNAIDNSGNGYDGALSGATLTTDRNGNSNSAYHFDGVDDYIDWPNVSALKPQLPISYSFWMKMDDISEPNAIVTSDFLQNDYHGTHMLVRANTADMTLVYGTGGGCTGSACARSKIGSTSLSAGVWYHVVGVIRGANDMDIYIDCVNDGGSYGGSSNNPMAYSTVAGSVGRKDSHTFNPPYYFHGSIDDLAYWNRALTQQDVEEICQNGIVGIDEKYKLVHVEVYPNPSNDVLNITAGNASFQSIRIYNALGQNVLEVPYSTVLDISQLPSGIYTAQLTGEQQAVTTFVKR